MHDRTRARPAATKASRSRRCRDEILNALPEVFWKGAVLAAAWGQLGDYAVAAGAVGDLLALKADFARTGRDHFHRPISPSGVR